MNRPHAQVTTRLTRNALQTALMHGNRLFIDFEASGYSIPEFILLWAVPLLAGVFIFLKSTMRLTPNDGVEG